MSELPKVDPTIALRSSALITTTEGAIPCSSAVQNTIASNHSLQTPPFVGFAGRCFMRVCLLAEIVDSWVRAEQMSPSQQGESAGGCSNWVLTGWFRSTIGAIFCNLAAASLVAIFWTSDHRSLVLLIFLIVVSYIALRFGHIAGLIGTIGAALLFASILFEPRPSLAMSNPIERDFLFLMVILGISASEILGHHRSSAEYNSW
jgi:hypothetical protein